MDKSSEEGCSMYALQRAYCTVGLDRLFKDHDENLLQAVDNLIQSNTSMFDGLLSAHDPTIIIAWNNKKYIDTLETYHNPTRSKLNILLGGVF